MMRFAIVLVRDGVLPAGADEAAAEADGNVAIIGTRTELVDLGLLPSAAAIFSIECAWNDRIDAALQLVRQRNVDVVICPSSPDGRDSAPRVAARMGWPLFAGAVTVHADTVELSRVGGRVIEEYRLPAHSVVTLIPGLRGATPFNGAPDFNVHTHSSVDPQPRESAMSSAAMSAVVTEHVLPADAATIDLAEANRIVAGGQGLASGERFAQLGRIGEHLDASLGGTRAASDAGWIPFERQIGTTGVAVNPRLYLAFAISGATQHVSGLGNPDHIISVNTDSSCPMMAMANVAIVADANAVLDALEDKLLARSTSTSKEKAAG